MKKILTIQDFSCVGKCSLTVAIPLVSAFGIECCALPTALLSTHTQFENWTFTNLCGQIDPIKRAWEKENIKFGGIYTGYLGGIDIIENVKEIIKKFNDGGIVMVDPAMGDDGELYANFDMEYVSANKTLCAMADVITPNITEAAFMLGMDYKKEYGNEYLLEMCRKLRQNGAKNVVITGVRKAETQVGVFCLLQDGEVFEYYTEREQNDFHGTGDVFASVFYGGLSCGKPLKEAVKFACDYTKKSIAATLAEPNYSDYGVDFEKCIKDITNFA